jgi:DNA-binding CsgD family transcriptional regulator
MFENADARVLAEVVTRAESLFEYESGTLEIVGKRVGFDVAMWKRAGGFGAYTPGLDPVIREACLPYFRTFGEETAPVAQTALRQGQVAVDVDVLGMRRMERLSFYQRLMRPHGGTSTAIVCLTRRRAIIGCLALGRTRGSFRDVELSYLRQIAPTLSVCEATAVSGPVPPVWGGARLTALTSRERDVLGYLKLGYTNSQIATALGTAERTVRNQLSRAYEKLGVASRAEAVALCAELGLAGYDCQ